MQKGTTMVVTKKSDGKKEAQEKSSSMVVRFKDEEDNSDEDDVEGNLYNLMRGHTSLMIAANFDTESDRDEENSDDESSDEESSDEESSVEESSEDDNHDLSKKALQPDRNSSCEDWGAPLTAENTPKWGNKEEVTDPEWANEWRNKGKAQDRRSRDSEIARGGSPPPKLEEENLFSEGNSRKTSKQACV